MMLHSDEGYQKDVGDPKAMDAVLSELKQHPEQLSRSPLYLVAEACTHPKRIVSEVYKHVKICVQSFNACLSHLVTVSCIEQRAAATTVLAML